MRHFKGAVVLAVMLFSMCATIAIAEGSRLSPSLSETELTLPQELISWFNDTLKDLVQVAPQKPQKPSSWSFLSSKQQQQPSAAAVDDLPAYLTGVQVGEIASEYNSNLQSSYASHKALSVKELTQNWIDQCIVQARIVTGVIAPARPHVTTLVYTSNNSESENELLDQGYVAITAHPLTKKTFALGTLILVAQRRRRSSSSSQSDINAAGNAEMKKGNGGGGGGGGVDDTSLPLFDFQITNFNTTLPFSMWQLGGSTKSQDAGLAGNFGEGVKVEINRHVASGATVKYTTGHEHWLFHYDFQRDTRGTKLGTTPDILYIRSTRAQSFTSSSSVTVQGMNPSAFSKTDFLFLQPARTSLSVPGVVEILTTPEHAGSVYSQGILVQSECEELSGKFGINFLTSDTQTLAYLQVTRDRESLNIQRALLLFWEAVDASTGDARKDTLAFAVSIINSTDSLHSALDATVVKLKSRDTLPSWNAAWGPSPPKGNRAARANALLDSLSTTAPLLEPQRARLIVSRLVHNKTIQEVDFLLPYIQIMPTHPRMVDTLSTTLSRSSSSSSSDSAAFPSYKNAIQTIVEDKSRPYLTLLQNATPAIISDGDGIRVVVSKTGLDSEDVVRVTSGPWKGLFRVYSIHDKLFSTLQEIRGSQLPTFFHVFSEQFINSIIPALQKKAPKGHKIVLCHSFTASSCECKSYETSLGGSIAQFICVPTALIDKDIIRPYTLPRALKGVLFPTVVAALRAAFPTIKDKQLVLEFQSNKQSCLQRLGPVANMAAVLDFPPALYDAFDTTQRNFPNCEYMASKLLLPEVVIPYFKAILKDPSKEPLLTSDVYQCTQDLDFFADAYECVEQTLWTTQIPPGVPTVQNVIYSLSPSQILAQLYARYPDHNFTPPNYRALIISPRNEMKSVFDSFLFRDNVTVIGMGSKMLAYLKYTTNNKNHEKDDGTFVFPDAPTVLRQMAARTHALPDFVATTNAHRNFAQRVETHLEQTFGPKISAQQLMLKMLPGLKQSIVRLELENTSSNTGRNKEQQHVFIINAYFLSLESIVRHFGVRELSEACCEITRIDESIKPIEAAAKISGQDALACVLDFFMKPMWISFQEAYGKNVHSEYKSRWRRREKGIMDDDIVVAVSAENVEPLNGANSSPPPQPMSVKVEAMSTTAPVASATPAMVSATVTPTKADARIEATHEPTTASATHYPTAATATPSSTSSNSKSNSNGFWSRLKKRFDGSDDEGEDTTQTELQSESAREKNQHERRQNEDFPRGGSQDKELPRGSQDKELPRRSQNEDLPRGGSQGKDSTPRARPRGEDSHAPLSRSSSTASSSSSSPSNDDNHHHTYHQQQDQTSSFINRLRPDRHVDEVVSKGRHEVRRTETTVEDHVPPTHIVYASKFSSGFDVYTQDGFALPYDLMVPMKQFASLLLRIWTNVLLQGDGVQGTNEDARSAVNLYYDDGPESGKTAAFARDGQLFFNLIWFVRLKHDQQCEDGMWFWTSTFCHELAHLDSNVGVIPHGQKHTSAFEELLVSNLPRTHELLKRWKCTLSSS